MNIFWTDGSAVPNPGLGGWAVIDEKTSRPVLIGRAEDTTNIRMEATAIIEAIKFSGEKGVEIHTDSEFWINVLTKWAPAWEANNWQKKHGEIKNLDLVQELYELYQKYPVRLVWVKGHVGTKLNELADHWANRARLGEKL